MTTLTLIFELPQVGIKLERSAKAKTFTVTYGRAVQRGLSREVAGRALGACIMDAVSVDLRTARALELCLRDAHQGQGNTIDFRTWLKDMADNPEGTLRKAAKHLLDLKSWK